ncbi:MAG TPA: hypothetical protein PKJ84_03035 [Anaerolineales bacterium]|nr:hypothetical protein [Anaerolineales bacterium]
MNFDYGNILTRALKLTWKHKSFWLLLMIPVFISFMILATIILPVIFLTENEESMTLIMVLWAGIVIFGFLASFIIGAVSMNAVTLGILRAERGEGSTALMDVVRDSFQYFKNAFGAVLIVQLSVGAVFTVFFLCMTALTLVTMGIASICLQPIMLLLTPLSFLVGAVLYGALVAVIDEGLGALDAVKRAVQVVRDHVWKFVVISLIAYFGSMVVSSIFTFPLMIPAMFGPALIESGVDITGNTFALIFIPFLCIFGVLMAFVSGVTGTFIAASMEISYLQLSRPVPEVIFAADAPKDATS